MCGILGGVNFEVDNGLLSLLKHRGPDRQDIFNDRINHHGVVMAHTRLSIVDLSHAGDQPMLSDCGNYCIVFNGEIYNHTDLRKKLNKQDFKGHSDTETILYYIIENGIESICDFNGIFAFGFYDRAKQKIYIARDRFGVKPLYYFYDKEMLIFSSEIRPVKKIIDTGPDLNSLCSLLKFRYNPSPSTLFKGIKKMRPGHVGVFDLSEDNSDQVLFPYIKKLKRQVNIDFNEALNRYGNLIEKSIERQLMSDVEVGILLSGGVDSAITAAVAQRRLPYKMKAFTVGFDSKYSENEIGLAKETADHFGLEHHVKHIRSDDFFDILSKSSLIVEEPLTTTSIVPMYFLSQLASKSVKVVLSGQGADESLGGYMRYQGEILHNMYPNIFFKAASYLAGLTKTKNNTLKRGANSLKIKDDVERFLSSYTLFSSKEIEALTGVKDFYEDYVKYYYDLLGCANLPNSTERAMAVDMHLRLSDDLLLYADKLTMNFSTECRVPMLDTELVEFIHTLPQSYRVTRNNTKIIHKEYAKKVLPDKIISRKKLGFQSPTEIWFRENFNTIKEILLARDNKMLNYLEKNEIKKIIYDHTRGYNNEKQIFLLLSLYYWFKSV